MLSNVFMRFSISSLFETVQQKRTIGFFEQKKVLEA